MEVDRTYIDEITKLLHKASSNLESGRETEKRKVKEHTESRIENRHEKEELQLGRIVQDRVG